MLRSRSDQELLGAELLSLCDNCAILIITATHYFAMNLVMIKTVAASHNLDAAGFML